MAHLDRFQRISELFEKARVLQGDEREQFLDEAAREDPTLKKELERLLSYHETDGPLEAPEEALEAGFAAEAVEEETSRIGMPDSIGPYRPTRVLGQGGMGVVFLAVQAEGDFERPVAVKVLRPDRVDEELARRFRTERRILASLEHPNIASLIDGGTSEQGLPYVVMELIDGVDVVEYCTREQLSVRAIAELFRKICSAVEHAHRKLVVHRDLKPSNILVTSDGEPKLLDFGIAKIVGPEDTQHSLVLTQVGMRLLTPHYASPEQVRGEPVATATDVYSLGAILYELLAGVRAHRIDTLSSTQIEQAICEVMPPPPSLAITDEDSTQTGRARQMRRQLTGDLDVIVLAALRKEPERRYGSAAELSEDLRRWLAGLPVRAQRDTWGYRSRKFVRRHRWVLGAAGVFLLTVVGFAIAMTIQAARIAQERDVAQLESRISQEVREFLVGLFELATPHEARGEQVPARALLDRGARTIEYELSSDARLRAAMTETMGRAYRSLGLFEEAQGLLDQSTAMYAADGSRDDEAYARGLVLLAELATTRGHYDKADELFKEAIELHGARPNSALDVAGANMLRATLLTYTGRLKEAQQVAAEAHTQIAAEHDGPHEDVAYALHRLGTAQLWNGKFEEAEQSFLEAEALFLELFGENHPSRAYALRELALLYDDLGEYDKAERYVRQAIEKDLELLGENHPDYASDRYSLASILHRRGDLEAAEELFLEVLESDRETIGDHPMVALTLGTLANIYSKQGRFDEAQAYYDESLAIQRAQLPDDHPEIATTLSNIGTFLRRSLRGDARPYLEEALRRRLDIYDEDHPHVLTSKSSLAAELFDRGDTAAAEAHYREVLESRKAVLGEHPETAGSLLSLASVYIRARDDATAEELLSESANMYERTVGPDHLDTARAYSRLGATILRRGRPNDAAPLLRQALIVREAQLVPNHYDVARTRGYLAECLDDLGQYEEAEQLFLAAIAALEATRGPGNSTVMQMRAGLADLYDDMGRSDDAARVRAGG